MSENDEGTATEHPPVQSEEVRKAIIARSTAGDFTAIGQARKELEGDQPERESDGSTIPIVGGDPQSDHAASEAAEPIGAQAQPALLTTNGTLPVNHVASPSGLVPVSSVASDNGGANKLVQANLDATEKQILSSGFQKLSRSQVEAMSGNDIRAVATDRGYDIGEHAGTRGTRARFLAAQAKDSAIDEEK